VLIGACDGRHRQPWREQIIKDARTSTATIDRPVHGCVIGELDLSSDRFEHAQENRRHAPSLQARALRRAATSA
jgi:hypothetical protein